MAFRGENVLLVLFDAIFDLQRLAAFASQRINGESFPKGPPSVTVEGLRDWQNWPIPYRRACVYAEVSRAILFNLGISPD
jgi:hypothetical protein